MQGSHKNMGSTRMKPSGRMRPSSGSTLNFSKKYVSCMQKYAAKQQECGEGGRRGMRPGAFNA